jgi:hypothetical protein
MNRFRATVHDPEPFDFRGDVTSDKLNEIFNNMRTTILRTMLRSRRTRERVQEITLGQLYGTQLQIAHQEALRAEIDAMRNTGNKKTVHTSFYRDPDAGLPADVGITRDKVYGQISLAESNHWSKIPTYIDDFGDWLVSDSVSIYQDSEFLPHDHPLYWVLNQRLDRFWLDNTAEYQTNTTLKITMPKGIRGEVNSIGIIPFPIGGSRLLDVQYQGDSGLVTVPGFEASENPFRVHFAPSLFNDEIQITLGSSSVNNSGTIESFWGLSAIDVALVDYETSGTAYAKAVAPGSDTFSEITSFSADYSLDTNIPLDKYSNPPVVFKLQTTGGSIVYRSDRDPFPLTANNAPLAVTGSPTELHLRVDLREPVNRITPVVKGATFTYN